MSGKHPQGYKQPNRDGLRGIVTYVEPALAEQFKERAEKSGLTQRTVLESFIRDYAKGKKPQPKR